MRLVRGLMFPFLLIGFAPLVARGDDLAEKCRTRLPKYSDGAPPPATMEVECAVDQVTSGFLADRFAPILWFSPDEPLIERGVAVPQALPGDGVVSEDAPADSKAVVYYQTTTSLNSKPQGKDELVDLAALCRAKGVIVIRYFFYYSEDVGANSHHHDLESADFRVAVTGGSRSGNFVLRAVEVTGHAHGLHWYENHLRLAIGKGLTCSNSPPPGDHGCGGNSGRPCECDTVFPVTLLVEEGKHATCPDRNGDGLYTPGYDVNFRPNEAWGIRDDFGQRLIHRTYEARMTKRRQSPDRRFPPLSRFNAADRCRLVQDYERYARLRWRGPRKDVCPDLGEDSQGLARLERDRRGDTFRYELRSTREAAESILGRAAAVKGKKVAPAPDEGCLGCIADTTLRGHFEENDFFAAPRKATSTWRFMREYISLEFSRRHGEGLATVSVGGLGLLEKAGFGGWLVPRLTLATAPLLRYASGPAFRRIDLIYTRTASRWLEYYWGVNLNVQLSRSDPVLKRRWVPEGGLKLRLQPAELIHGFPHFFLGVRFGLQIESQEGGGAHGLRFVWQVGGGPW